MAAQPQPILTIDPKHRLVEGVASDGRTIWVSSVLDRQILACRSGCRTWARLPDGLYPFAIALDNKTRTLWVAADCPPGVPVIKACDRGVLIGLDERGRVRMQVTPQSGSFHPGDVSVSAAGTFVSDSQNGAVYLLARNGAALRPVVKPGVGKSGQGSALNGAGNRLVVADYTQGITTIDLATGIRTILLRRDGKPQRGIDGLVRCGSTYFGIYNGSLRGALMAISLRERDLSVDEVSALSDPTQLTYDGKRMLIVVDSGWATIDKPESSRVSGAQILAVPLSKDCKPQ